MVPAIEVKVQYICIAYILWLRHSIVEEISYVAWGHMCNIPKEETLSFWAGDSLLIVLYVPMKHIMD